MSRHSRPDSAALITGTGPTLDPISSAHTWARSCNDDIPASTAAGCSTRRRRPGRRAWQRRASPRGGSNGRREARSAPHPMPGRPQRRSTRVRGETGEQSGLEGQHLGRVSTGLVNRCSESDASPHCTTRVASPTIAARTARPTTACRMVARTFAAMPTTTRPTAATGRRATGPATPPNRRSRSLQRVAHPGGRRSRSGWRW